MTKHTLFVCKSCAYSSTQRDYLGQRGGCHLLNHLLRLQSQWTLVAEYAIEAVKCLSACNRPCVVAYVAPYKTTLMFGDLPPLQSAIAILQLAEQYHASSDGLIPRQERPDILKKGILARIPPCQAASPYIDNNY
jgi:predicted metal-binding protein